MFSRDRHSCREFDNFVLTFIISDQKFTMLFISITNGALMSVMNQLSDLM